MAPPNIDHSLVVVSVRSRIEIINSVLSKPPSPLEQWNNQVVKPQLERRQAQIAEAIRIEKARQAAVEAARIAEEKKQAQALAEQQKAAQAPQTKPQVVTGGTMDAKILALKMCESGNNYAANTGNGYYGAYQYDIGTWANFGGYRLPSDAPPAVQDAKFAQTYAARGASPWPVCGARAGL